MRCDSVVYPNFGFDSNPGGNQTSAQGRNEQSMSVVFLPAFRKSDAVYTGVEIPEEYSHLLSEYGIDSASPCTSKKSLSGLSGIPWGWDKEALSFFGQNNIKTHHPPLSAVKRINERSFPMESDRLRDYVQGRVFTETNDLSLFLEKHQDTRYLIKPGLSSSGRGFIKSGRPFEEIRERVSGMIKRDGYVTAEPLKKRLCDISSSAYISEHGSILEYDIHTTLVNRAFTFFADIFDMKDSYIEVFRDRLESVIRDVCNAAFREGYFGPIGIDSFVYLESGELRLMPIVDINARLTIGITAKRVIDKLRKGRVSMYRFIARKKHSLPETNRELKSLLSSLHYTRRDDTGVMLLSPLRIIYSGESTWSTPKRSIFLIRAKTGKELEQTDAELRRRLS